MRFLSRIESENENRSLTEQKPSFNRLPVNCASMDMACEAVMTEEYLAVILLIKRLHRHFLDVVKLELDPFGIRDSNNVQAVMLFNVGDAEMTVGELTLHGCYLDS